MNYGCYNFNKEWKFSKKEHTILPKKFSHSSVYGFAKAAGVGGVAGLNYDDTDWAIIDAPHDWAIEEDFDENAIGNHAYKPSGKAWYRKKFRLECDETSSVYFEFEGIAGTSDIYVNGSKVSHNESRYNDFVVDISDIVYFGGLPNIITVSVDSTVWEGWWYEGAGIYRNIWLHIKPPIHMMPNESYTRTLLDSGSRWLTEFTATVCNTSEDIERYEVSASLYDQHNQCVSKNVVEKEITPYAIEEITLQIFLDNLHLWSLDDPYLYDFEVKIVSAGGMDNYTSRIGFRTVEVDPDKGFFLNGKPLKLLGVCNHQSHAGIGVAFTESIMRYRLKILKDMDANAYRAAHGNPTKRFFELCDEMGMLVMDENRNFSTSESNLNILRKSVKRSLSHPSVIMYSVFNEEPMQGTRNGKKLSDKMVAEIKKIAPERLVLGSFNGGFMEESGAALSFDITGINYFMDTYDKFHAKFPNQPMVASELVCPFATRSIGKTNNDTQVFDNFDGNYAPWGDSIRASNKNVLTRDFIMGLFVWTGFDYYGEPTPFGWPSVSSHFGAIDLCGFKKDIFYLYKAFWSKEAVLHLVYDLDANGKTPRKIMTYSNCERIDLYVNDKVIESKNNKINDQLEWLVEFDNKERIEIDSDVIRVLGYNNGIKVAEDRIIHYGAFDRFSFNVNTMNIRRDIDDLAIIDLFANDCKGNLVKDADTLVHLEVKGGFLVGTGNGNPNNNVNYPPGDMKLFGGCCQVMVKPSEAEDIQVKVTSESGVVCDIHIKVTGTACIPEVNSINTMIVSDWRMSHIASKDKPDITQSFSETDMNSLEPVIFNGETQSQFDGNEGKYCQYRASADFKACKKGRLLSIDSIAGNIECYIDKVSIGTINCEMASKAIFEVPENIQGINDIYFVIQNKVIDEKAGILSPVEILY